MQSRCDDEEAIGTPRPSSPENFFGSTSVVGEALTLVKAATSWPSSSFDRVASRSVKEKRRYLRRGSRPARALEENRKATGRPVSEIAYADYQINGPHRADAALGWLNLYTPSPFGVTRGRVSQ